MTGLEPFVVRRTAERSPPNVPSNPDLVARIRAEIAAGGPMTFARFMELALYDQEDGYYSAPEPRPTRGGDFLTAPELHPIFGAALARQVIEVWRRLGSPGRFTIREYGAGSGALAVPLLERLAVEAPALAAVVGYAPIEHNVHRLAELQARFERAGVAWQPVDRAAAMSGVVIANEFLDALPVHRVEGGSDERGGLRELYVDVGDEAGGASDAFIEVPGRPSTEALARRLADDGVVLAEGQRAEIRLGDRPWLAEVSGDLDRGAVLVIDYGLPASELYAPTRPDGTLVAYRGHHAHDDPFRAIGRQDLTAHVDLTALRAGALAAGLDILGETSQAEFLVGNGLEALVEEHRAAPGTDIAAWTTLRAAVARLLDPRRMGSFRVVVLGRGLPPEPSLLGLAFRLPDTKRARSPIVGERAPQKRT
jgi:SAM-dependent MidA family methyltransferase